MPDHPETTALDTPPAESERYWIAAARLAGDLPERTINSLSRHLVPSADGSLITLPPDTWQGMWKLMHMMKAIGEPAPTSGVPDAE